MDRFGQRVVDTDRDVAGKEGSRTGRIKAADTCKSVVHLDLSGIVGGHCIDSCLKRAHHLFKGVFTDSLAAAFTVDTKVAVGQRRGFAVFVDNILKRTSTSPYIEKTWSGVLRTCANCGQQCLLFSRQGGGHGRGWCFR